MSGDKFSYRQMPPHCACAGPLANRMPHPASAVMATKIER
jgi:hypothetical protein